jgi:hypothetical protein
MGLIAVRKPPAFSYIVIFSALAGYFWFLSQHRLIDNDEGFYLLAARLVLEHRTPYLDFFILKLLSFHSYMAFG